MIRCPLCELAWREGTKACHCGYDFSTRDPSVAIQRYKWEARRGNATWYRGVLMLLGVPLPFLWLDVLAVALLLAIVQIGIGAVWIVKGLARADLAGEKLAAAKQLMALPAARIVKR